jgi:hypothetical protein
MLGATTGENQLIGILEEDSEDFDEEDEDDLDEDPDGDDDMLVDHQATRDRMDDNDMDPFYEDQGHLSSSGNVFGETRQRRELLFGVNGEDVIEEEMLQSDDEGHANGMDDSEGEEFERNQSGDEAANAGGIDATASKVGPSGKSEKKKKKKKDANNGGGTASTSPTKVSKKDKKKKDNQAQQ